MRQGDMVFFQGQMIATLNKSIAIPDGVAFQFEFFMEHEPSFRGNPLRTAFQARTSRGCLRRIFNLGDIQHWELSIYGDATLKDVWRSGLFDEAKTKPSADPAGMVVALDLVLAQLTAGSIERSLLDQMRRFYLQRAEDERRRPSVKSKGE